VVIIDDDVRKQGRLLLGVPVVGDVSSLHQAVARYDADEVLVAIPSADQQMMRVALEGAELAQVPLKVLPPVRDLLGAKPSVRDARDLQIQDLLGRQQVETDLESLRATFAARRVMITGAGGSIGAEITTQIAALGPARLVLLDHDETHLHDVASRLDTGSDLDGGTDLDLMLTDIRDLDRLRRVFEQSRPELVFHAAAHKHVPLLEANPAEAVQTNVVGTANVVDCAIQLGVDRLVFVSTDKAVRPANVLGRSKWLGERIVLDRAPPQSRWCAVRFGNVLGSRGSVIPTFASQIAAGGPLTVTDPRMTRFFMSVREAVQLTLQAAALAEGGEIFMLDVGEPVNILELAERMIRLSGHVVGSEIAIRFIGIRPGEKLVEEIQAPTEEALPTAHPAIVRLRCRDALATERLRRGIEELSSLAAQSRDDEAAQRLIELTDGVDRDVPSARLAAVEQAT
jgi:FlaA1/EpsC-like NDP-sugar epimerase